MFEFLFKYPIPVFTRGKWILLGAWPGWVLLFSIAVSAGGLAWLVRRGLPETAPRIRNWRVWAVWGLEAAMVALLLVALWEPAITVAELKSQQNIIAVLVDDSRSMGIADAGADGKMTREAAAVQSLQDGVLAGLKKKFQVRVYRMDSGLSRIDGGAEEKQVLRSAQDGTVRQDDNVFGDDGLAKLGADAGATHINAGLQRLAAETSDLPVGAVVLLSDGAENGIGSSGGGIDLETITALHNRRLPVHAIGFGKVQPTRDVEIDDASVAAKAMANSRMTATVSFHQHGYAGQRATLKVKDGEKLLAAQAVTLEKDGVEQTETIFFNAGDAGVKSMEFALELMAGEESAANNAVTRLTASATSSR